MSEIVDVDAVDEIGAVDLDSVEPTPPITPEPEPVVPTEPEVPEKYRGKSVQDVIKMHQEAEAFASRQAQEVGEVRRLADELLRSQIRPKQETKVEPEIDFFADPAAAVSQAIKNNPEVQAAQQMALQTQQAMAKREFEARHPDVDEIMGDPGFREWVQSSKLRFELFKKADLNYDLEAADELLNTYRELRSLRKPPEPVSAPQTSKVDETVRKESMRAAAVDTGGSGETGKKVFRRADLIRLKMTNPAKYEAMQDDIDRAYQEGRVR